MNNINIFFNNRMTSNDSFGLAKASVGFGDFCLTPIRCLFNGNKVVIHTENDVVTINHEKAYASSSDWGWYKPKRTFLRVVVSIAFLVPGLIAGSIFKGLGYLSKSIREKHSLTIQHYTPVDRTIGSKNERLDLNNIIHRLGQERYTDSLHRPTKTLIVYAQPNTEINVDPGFLALNPLKIILVGAKIVHQPCAAMGGRLDDILAQNPDWQTKGIREVRNGTPANFGTFVTQWQMNSIGDALKDVPPKKSVFSSERYKRIYVVN